MEKFVAIGLGGAGYTAGIYAARYGMNPILIGEADGGLITENHMVENFPGYPNGASGYQIMEDIKNQAINAGARIIQDSVKSIELIDANNPRNGYKINTTFNGIIESQTILLATGSSKRKLGAPGEKEYFGKGVSYCATCDGFFYRGKTVAVVGGGDSALIEAMYMSDICAKVYIIHRRNEFRGEQLRLERLKAKTNVEFVTPAVIEQIGGENKVQFIDVKVDGVARKIELDGVFIAIGTLPRSVAGIDELITKDEQGYIKVDDHMQTNLLGVYAAGDCSTGSAKFRQLITACAEGAIAVESAFKFFCNN